MPTSQGVPETKCLKQFRSWLTTMALSERFIHYHDFFMALHSIHDCSTMVIFVTFESELIIHDHESDEKP